MSVSPVSGVNLPFTARADLPLGFVEDGEDWPTPALPGPLAKDSFAADPDIQQRKSCGVQARQRAPC